MAGVPGRPARAVPAALALAVMVAGCASPFGPPLPDSLNLADTPEQRRLHAQATDGCAFAGTWRYDNRIPEGRLEGVIVAQAVEGEIQAMHRVSAEEIPVEAEGATCPYRSCDLCGAETTCKRGYFLVAYVEPGGRSAGGATLNPDQGTGRIELLLSQDGQGLELSFQTPARYFTVRASKLRGGACETAVPYIQSGAKWATRNYPLSLLRLEARGEN